jgi:diguanylate cyclase (GGDEF)-like protein
VPAATIPAHVGRRAADQTGVNLLRRLRSYGPLVAGALAITGAIWLAARADHHGGGRTVELIGVGVIAGLSLLVGVIGVLMAVRARQLDHRRAVAEHQFRIAQVELADALQTAHTETDAYALLRRHLERTVPGSEVIVLRRDGSAGAVEPATFVPDSTTLARRLRTDAPWTCDAIRTGRPHETGAGCNPETRCSLCGADGRRSLCVPAVVGGELVGSVLVEHRDELSEVERLRIIDSVAQSAAVLASLRSLARAEARSAADDLTGLPNRRALQGNLRRMTAQAGRALSCLSLVTLDVDHLRRLNENLGDSKGDLALAAVAHTAAELLRTSDLATRVEGGEFVLVLPDTHKDGAIEVAEKIRLGITRVDIPGLDWPL